MQGNWENMVCSRIRFHTYTKSEYNYGYDGI